MNKPDLGSALDFAVEHAQESTAERPHIDRELVRDIILAVLATPFGCAAFVVAYFWLALLS